MPYHQDPVHRQGRDNRASRADAQPAPRNGAEGPLADRTARHRVRHHWRVAATTGTMAESMNPTALGAKPWLNLKTCRRLRCVLRDPHGLQRPLVSCSRC